MFGNLICCRKILTSKILGERLVLNTFNLKVGIWNNDVSNLDYGGL